MLSQKLTDELNEQIRLEFYSSHLYLAAAAYCYTIDLEGFANFFIVQAEEEKFHAMKFFHYINEMDATIQIKNFEVPKSDYSDIEDLVNYTYNHEKSVTDRIYLLMDIATKENEFATISFLKWFVDEQVEEMATFKSLLQKLKRSNGNQSILFKLDDELATRVFTPPTTA